MNSSRPGRANRLLLAALLALAATGPTIAQPVDLDEIVTLREDRHIVGLSASAFEVFAATRQGLLVLPRHGNGPPRFLGRETGAPLDDLARIEWDDSLKALTATTRTGRRLALRPGSWTVEDLPRDHRPHPARTTKFLAEPYPAFLPEGSWTMSGGGIRSPAGFASYPIVAVMVLDRSQVWIATWGAGLWQGRMGSLRLARRPVGLQTPCVEHLAEDRQERVWAIGCEGGLTIFDLAGRIERQFDPDEPDYRVLRAARSLAPTARGGMWIGTDEGAVHLDRDGAIRRRLGRNAPFGGSTRRCAERGDTVWCATASGISRLDPGAPDFVGDLPPSSPFSGTAWIGRIGDRLLAATEDGFWWRDSTWSRPPFDRPGATRILDVAVGQQGKPPHRFRVAWHDGRTVRVATHAIVKGAAVASDSLLASWIPSEHGGIEDIAWDRDGLLHATTVDGWTVWNPENGESRSWNPHDGLPGGDIHAVLPAGDKVVVGGEGGVSIVPRIPYLPPSARARTSR